MNTRAIHAIFFLVTSLLGIMLATTSVAFANDPKGALDSQEMHTFAAIMNKIKSLTPPELQGVQLSGEQNWAILAELPFENIRLKFLNDVFFSKYIEVGSSTILDETSISFLHSDGVVAVQSKVPLPNCLMIRVLTAYFEQLDENGKVSLIHRLEVRCNVAKDGRLQLRRTLATGKPETGLHDMPKDLDRILRAPAEDSDE